MSEKCPVLKFIGYDHVVVLYKGSPAIARIKSIEHECKYSLITNDNFGSLFTDIHDIIAPNNTVCDIDPDDEYEQMYKSKIIGTGTRHYWTRSGNGWIKDGRSDDWYSDSEKISLDEAEKRYASKSHKRFFIIASNIRVEN